MACRLDFKIQLDFDTVKMDVTSYFHVIVWNIKCPGYLRFFPNPQSIGYGFWSSVTVMQCCCEVSAYKSGFQGPQRRELSLLNDFLPSIYRPFHLWESAMLSLLW